MMERQPQAAVQRGKQHVQLSVGHLVWAPFLVGIKKMWPAVIIRESDCGEEHAAHGCIWVFVYGGYTTVQICLTDLVPFAPNFDSKYVNYPDSCYGAAVTEAIRECAFRAQLFDIGGDNDLLDWAKQGFKPFSEGEQFLPPDPEYPVPEIVGSHFAKKIFDLRSVPRKGAAQKVLEGQISIEDMCIACNRSNINLDCVHPFFVGGLCFNCKENIKLSMYVYNNGMELNCCTICGRKIEPGMITCGSCNRFYCRPCVTNLVGPVEFKQAKAQSKWHCYMCMAANSFGILRKRKNWKENLLKFRFYHPILQLPTPDLVNYQKKRPIRVLALFDEHATGKFALEDIGIAVDKYYMTVFYSQEVELMYFPSIDGAEHLGGIKRLSEEKISQICPIDLLIGSLPSSSLEQMDISKKDYAQFGTTIAFCEYYRVFEAVFKLNKGHPLFWLFESDASMSQVMQNKICQFLGSEPIAIDLSDCRQSVYCWSNLPEFYRPLCTRLMESNVSGVHGSYTSRETQLTKKVDNLYVNDTKALGNWTHDKLSDVVYTQGMIDKKILCAIVRLERLPEIQFHCKNSSLVLKDALTPLMGYFSKKM